ncbi:cytochrome P450, partial [Streptomyces sp. NPDC056500]|uniref:cytochrome P450 n=1 Tax=Streptomyces sp. NPDC056500 TaxID=3345840 RepID=UPI0036C6ED03
RRQPETEPMNTTTVPTAPGALPYVGHAITLLRDPLAFLRSLPSYGDLVTIRIGPFRGLVVCDAELTRRLLLDDKTFDKGGPLFNRMREILGNGLAVCPHSDHRRNRRRIQPAFHQARITGYASVMTHEATIRTASWHDGQELDVMDEMMGMAARTLLRCMFRTELSTTTLDELVADITTVMDGIYRRAIVPAGISALPTPANRRYERARARLRHTLGALAAARSAEDGHQDLLSILLSEFNDNEIIDELVTFLIGGTDTVASVLSWTLHLLAQHPSALQNVHTELENALGARPPAPEDLPVLQATHRVITETLRLYPPGWLLMRATTTDTSLGTHDLPAGTTVLYSPYLLHHHPDLHHDANAFRPERWTQEYIASIPRGAFVPFGAGARKCIGDTFAITECVLALATILTHWDITPVPNRSVRAGAGLALTPRGLILRTTARRNSGLMHPSP